MPLCNKGFGGNPARRAESGGREAGKKAAASAVALGHFAVAAGRGGGRPCRGLGGRLLLARFQGGEPLFQHRHLGAQGLLALARRSEEHTSELQSLMRTSYAVFCLKKNNNTLKYHTHILTSPTHTSIP